MPRLLTFALILAAALIPSAPIVIIFAILPIAFLFTATVARAIESRPAFAASRERCTVPSLRAPPAL